MRLVSPHIGEIAWSSLLLILFLGLILSHVPLPLGGDQGLYLYGAKELSGGAVLYKDFWDLKSPGVYLFYLLAGSIFGFNVLGLHVLEVAWLGLAACFALLISRAGASNRWVVPLAPLLTIGALFVAATPWHLTQPDGLVILPIMAGAWALGASASPEELPAWRFFVAGAAAGVAAIFVTLMIFVVLGLLIVFIAFEAYRQGKMFPVGVARRVGSFIAGLSVPTGILLAVSLLQDGLREVLWTLLSYPFAARAVFDYELPKLAHSVTWFYGANVSLLPAISVGVLITFQRLVRKDRAALPGLLMMAWLAFGGLAILLQYHYSWEFHFNQFFVPMGILAVIGLDEVMQKIRTDAAKAVCGAVLLVSLTFPALAVKKMSLLDSFSDRTSAYEKSVRAGMAGASHADSLYVFGDPRVLLASARKQAVAFNGWALEVMVDEQWTEFSRALRSASPSYLYLHSSYRSLLQEKAPEISAWIAAEYHSVCTDNFEGTWLRRDVAAPETANQGSPAEITSQVGDMPAVGLVRGVAEDSRAC